MRSAFGQKIRALRAIKEVSGQHLADKLGCSQAAISKIESGQTKPSLELCDRISRGLRLNKEERADLEQIVRGILFDFDRWTFEESDQYLTFQSAIAEAEATASTYWAFTWNVIPGLLQSSDYMRALHQPYNFESDRLNDIIKARLKRQKILKDRERTFRFLFCEQALYSLVSSVPVHVSELRRLKSLMTANAPNMSIRVIPRARRLGLIPTVNFMILNTRQVLIDDHCRTHFVWYEQHVESYNVLFDDLWTRGESGKAVLALIEDSIQSFGK